MADHKRPLLITVIAVLYILCAIIFIAAGAVAAVVDVSVDLGGLGSAVGAGVIIVGIIYLIIGVGFLKGWSIMWYLGIIFSIIGIIMGILSVSLGTLWAPSGILYIVIHLIVLWYLFRPKVKAFFLD